MRAAHSKIVTLGVIIVALITLFYGANQIAATNSNGTSSESGIEITSMEIDVQDEISMNVSRKLIGDGTALNRFVAIVDGNGLRTREIVNTAK